METFFLLGTIDPPTMRHHGLVMWTKGVTKEKLLMQFMTGGPVRPSEKLSTTFPRENLQLLIAMAVQQETGDVDIVLTMVDLMHEALQVSSRLLPPRLTRRLWFKSSVVFMFNLLCGRLARKIWAFVVGYMTFLDSSSCGWALVSLASNTDAFLLF